MSDIRLIRIYDDGRIEKTAKFMHIPLNPFEHAVQRAVVAIENTPGTMIDATNFGGGAKNMQREAVRTVIQQAFSSLNEDPDDDFAIIEMSLLDVTPQARGYVVSIRFRFRNATSEDLDVVI